MGTNPLQLRVATEQLEERGDAVSSTNLIFWLLMQGQRGVGPRDSTFSAHSGLLKSVLLIHDFVLAVMCLRQVPSLIQRVNPDSLKPTILLRSNKTYNNSEQCIVAGTGRRLWLTMGQTRVRVG